MKMEKPLITVIGLLQLLSIRLLTKLCPITHPLLSQALSLGCFLALLGLRAALGSFVDRAALGGSCAG